MIEIIGGLWDAGETKTFVINGEYLEILEAQYPCDVMLMDKSGAQLSIMRSSEASFFSRPKEGFQTVQITSANAQSIRVFIGSGDAGTRRISSTVQVVDGGRARSIAGAAYMCAIGQTAAAGQYGSLQLFNPAGSGVRAVVKAMSCAMNASGAIAVGWFNSAFAGTPYSNKKLFSAPASKALMRGSVNGAQTLVAPYVDYVLVGALVTVQKAFQEPMVILPGEGIMLEASVVNTQINAAFEWTEEAV